MMKKLALPAVVGFGVALALIIGQRMSTDAMAVVVGVAVGVTASVPTSLLLVAMLRRERTVGASWRTEAPAPLPQLPQPNIIVLNPADLSAGRSGQMQVPLPPPDLQLDGGLRRLRVIGDDEEWSR
jgi:hypothetical protein